MPENNAGSREAALAAARQALLQKRIQGVTVAAAPRGIPRRPDRERAPVSFAQQRLWFIDQLAPGNPSYNIPTPVRVQGPLDAAAMERAVGEMVRRQDALRTTLRPDEAGTPVQHVAPPGGFALPVTDLEPVPAAEREAELERRLHAEAARPFDLAAGPLFRATLFRVAPDDHVLLLVVHHVVGDGYSSQLMVREVAALYGAFSRGLPSPLPELRAQYGDFAAWQRNRLQGAAFEKQVAYWTERLRGAPPLLEIPADRVRPPMHGHAGGSEPLEVPAGVADGLRALARAEGATLFNVLLAALAVHLGRYARQDDVVVGIPVDSRGLPELEEIVGIFLNTLPVRTRLDGEPTFREVVRRVRAETAGALAHQDVQFEKLVDELKVERSLSHTPIFQVMFTFHEAHGGAAGPGEEPETRFRAMHADTGKVSFDLGLVVGAGPAGVAGKWSYSAELFRPETAARMARAFESLLARAAADPDRPVAALSLLDDGERDRVLLEWNDTARPFPDAPVHRLLEARAAQSPGAAALEWEGGRLTFGELDARADALAARLRARGVGPETRVAVALERGPEMPVAVLAVLKAGGAYVPVDPAYPAGRVALVLADSAAPVLATTAALRERFDAFGGEVLCVDEGMAPGDAGEVPVDPGNLAYVVYTSGSTGKPKGVLVEHRGLANLLLAAVETFGFEPGDVVPALASYAFDIWGFEVLAPLLAGSTVRLVPAARVTEPDELLDALADATVLHAVPALMRQIVDAARGRGGLPRLRRAFVGGDSVPAALLVEMREVFSAAETRVLYGPTEATVLATSFPVPAGGPVEGRPIGGPLPNVRVYVCDARGGPVLVGAPGEVLIGGAGVARGYLGRPGLTAEKFVPDPFSGEPGARLYRTGDVARWVDRGTLEFLGRTDAQVKVRGFRIEPGEVEAALLRRPEVREAVVVAREDRPGDRRLVAYFVPSPDAAGTLADLRAALQAELPEHMVPSSLVVLDAIPTTPNGKVDARALPAPDAAAERREHVEPRSALERVLAGIWRDVLGVERVGITDSFFDLGGHSLLATQVSTRLKASKIQAPVRMLFQHPTVEEMARALVAAEPRPGQTEKVAALIEKVQGLSAEERERIRQARPGAGVEG
uniref:Long-chain-fatty-acid--CoA ligase n=1 Tax=uncultured bacterium esnapd24 TaxID=1366606 RepID=S5UDB2_9BACT|nr:long-chain-fatty-acid--CoA ligase [uncultured bacterium esnapd24]